MQGGHSSIAAVPIESRLRNDVDVLRHIDGLLVDLEGSVMEAQNALNIKQEGPTTPLDPEGHSNSLSIENEGYAKDVVEVLEEIGTSVTQLFRASRIVQQVDTDDLFIRALRDHPQQFDDNTDIVTIGKIYPKLNTDSMLWLRTRLGRATTIRRCYLEFIQKERRKKHITSSAEPSDVLSHAIVDNETRGEGPSIDPLGVSFRPPPLSNQLGGQSTGESSTNVTQSDTITPKKRSLSTSMPATDPVTRKFARFVGEDAESDSDESDLTTSSLEMPDNAQTVPSGALDLVRIAAQLSASTEELDCPFCLCTRKSKTGRSWQHHILSDLRPYVCTFQGCNAPLFSDKNTWFSHEMLSHRARYSCTVCKGRHFASKTEYLQHTEEEHQVLIQKGYEEALLRVGRKPTDSFKTSDCPCCTEWTGMAEEHGFEDQIRTADGSMVPAIIFRDHLASHLESLLMQVIPTIVHPQLPPTAPPQVLPTSPAQVPPLAPLRKSDVCLNR